MIYKQLNIFQIFIIVKSYGSFDGKGEGQQLWDLFSYWKNPQKDKLQANRLSKVFIFDLHLYILLSSKTLKDDLTSLNVFHDTEYLTFKQ